ncbi:MAG: MliC family protein [Alphaproteobacteria bacterium]|nr:hypothetical protein [Alphaproteobacteria bacterium]MBQ7290045.1 MliC family protein [Alphaproteobacteria bacterium]
MKKIILSIILAVSLCACGDKNSDIRCGDYSISSMVFDADGAVLRAVVNDVPVDLNLVVSASGAKYDGVLGSHNIVLWHHSNTWTMFVDDGVGIECK